MAAVHGRPLCAKTCRCSKLELWTPRPSARLTTPQYSTTEPRWITGFDQGKKNSLFRSAPQYERTENNSTRLR
jgi:hypothetical protein